jgi:hypothetical protein
MTGIVRLNPEDSWIAASQRLLPERHWRKPETLIQTRETTVPSLGDIELDDWAGKRDDRGNVRRLMQRARTWWRESWRTSRTREAE